MGVRFLSKPIFFRWGSWGPEQLTGFPKVMWVNGVALTSFVCVCLFLAVLRLHCCARAFSSWGEQWLFLLQSMGSRVQVQSLLPMGFVAPWHVEPFRSRNGTRGPCSGRRILNHWATRKVQMSVTSNLSLRYIGLLVCLAPGTFDRGRLTDQPQSKWAWPRVSER